SPPSASTLPSFGLVLRPLRHLSRSFFSFSATATTEIYTLSLHDALPIFHTADRIDQLLDGRVLDHEPGRARLHGAAQVPGPTEGDRKSTRLNSSHVSISYAVFCLKKKKKTTKK